MAVHLRVDEKRLKLLRQQLYGKGVKVKKSFASTKGSEEKIPTESIKSEIPLGSYSSTPSTDATFLKTDLIKILILTAIALVIQFSLYFAIQRGLINLGSLSLF
jgi:hypothetical protein